MWAQVHIAVCVCVCVCVCIIDPFRASPLESWFDWAEKQRGPLRSRFLCLWNLNTAASHYPSFQLSRPRQQIPPSSLLVFHFPTSVLLGFYPLAPSYSFVLSSPPLLPPSPAICSGCLFSPHLLSVLTLASWPRADVWSDGTTWLEEKGDKFPLVCPSISNGTVRCACRTLNHRWEHETLTETVVAWEVKPSTRGPERVLLKCNLFKNSRLEW